MRVHHSVSHREANHEVADEQGDRPHQQERQQFKRIQAHTVTLYARREGSPERHDSGWLADSVSSVPWGATWPSSRGDSQPSVRPSTGHQREAFTGSACVGCAFLSG